MRCGLKKWVRNPTLSAISRQLFHVIECVRKKCESSPTFCPTRTTPKAFGLLHREVLLSAFREVPIGRLSAGGTELAIKSFQFVKRKKE